MRIRGDSGFTLLEMVIAMSIIAIVLAFSLMLMGDGMRKAVKANTIVTAAALAQYEIDRVKNIAFPPTTDDRQDEFNDTDQDPYPYDSDYRVEVLNDSYDAGGSGPISDTSYDATMIREITVNVYKTGSSDPLVTLTTYVARNGEI
ncbi:type II secretion system protein [bacterium]|nr:type II secretion system protein [bacterium]